jgi:glycosyltransferase involved in cell wall biosynthesis
MAILAPPRSKRVVVVMPAYNAERTLERTLADVPHDWVDDIILVDDASRDGTVALARKLGLRVVAHETNLGYGANQKTCYREALASGADIVVMVHPDHQYDPRVLPDLVEPILAEEADAVFGSRMLGGRTLEGGMPRWKYYANVFLTACANVVFLRYFTEIHSGLRAYSRHYLSSVALDENSDNFIFDTEIIAQGIARKMRFREIPIETRYFDEASQIDFRRSVQYGLSILWVLFKFKLNAWGLWQSAIFR